MKRHIRYIARDVAVPLERTDGEAIEGDRDALDAIAEERSAGFHEHGGRARNSINMLISCPPGMDRESVEAAARSFADSTFAASRDYVMARHDDTAHPHVHLIAETIGADGARLSFDPEAFQGLRGARIATRRINATVLIGARRTAADRRLRTYTGITHFKIRTNFDSSISAVEEADRTWSLALRIIIVC